MPRTGWKYEVARRGDNSRATSAGHHFDQIKLMKRTRHDHTGQDGIIGWRRSIAVYSDHRVLLVLLLGFSSGLPLLLTFSTFPLACHRGCATRGDRSLCPGWYTLCIQIPLVAAH